MRSRLRRAAVALAAALGLVSAPLLMTTAASAADLSGVQAVFFTNEVVTDVDEEDLALANALTAAGATLTPFTGGDGSAAAWSEALAYQTMLVLPEAGNGPLYEPGGTAVMSDEAAQVVAGWVADGGRLVLIDPVDAGALLDLITGLDYTTGFPYSSSGSPWPIVDPVDGLPAELQYSDATEGFDATKLGLAEVEAIDALYATSDIAVVGTITVGNGLVAFFGYDWFPDDVDIAEGDIVEWNLVLTYVVQQIYVPVPERPALAATGVASASPVIWIGAGLFVLVGGALVAFRIRAARKA